MKIGFTGTRNGMTDAQKTALRGLLREQQYDSFIFEVHHGDCVGADDEFVNIACEVYRCLVRVVCHPPVDESLRAFNQKANLTMGAKTHFARNRDIVDETSLLIACPSYEPLPTSGGTAYTVGYAARKGKRVKVIWPDGRIEDR